MAKVKVYSRAMIAHQFYNPTNDHHFVLKGMNSHPLQYSEILGNHTHTLNDPRTPVENFIDEEDWNWLKATYGHNPAYFHKFNGDLWFTAPNDKLALDKAGDMKPIVDDMFLVSKQKGIKKLAKGE